MNIVTAFFYTGLKKKIYMQQPIGFEKDDQVYLLLRALYGLKQSPRE